GEVGALRGILRARVPAGDGAHELADGVAVPVGRRAAVGGDSHCHAGGTRYGPESLVAGRDARAVSVISSRRSSASTRSIRDRPRCRTGESVIRRPRWEAGHREDHGIPPPKYDRSADGMKPIT